MRHRKLASRLGRTSAHRRAMFRNLVTALLEHERIETTDAKARQVRRLTERMITLGKRGTLDARRRALRVVRSRQVTAKLFSDLADRYRERPGGYTRAVKTRFRTGDAAPISIVELVERGATGEPAAEVKRRRGVLRRKRTEAETTEPTKGRRERAAQPDQGKGAAKSRRRPRDTGKTAEEVGERGARGRRRGKEQASEGKEPSKRGGSGRAKTRTSKSSGRKKSS